MDDLRIILHRALPDTPPGVAISREAAIAAGRRERKRQRWVRALGAFLSNLLIAGGVAWGVSLRSPTALTYGGASPSPATASAAPAPSPTPVVVANPTLRADLDLAALSATLLGAATRVAPGFTFQQVLTSRPARRPRRSSSSSQGGVKAWADLKDAQGVGTVFINLNPSPYAANSENFPHACANLGPGVTCETRTGPAGELITIQTGPLGADVGDAVERDRVQAQRHVGLCRLAQLQPERPAMPPHPRRSDRRRRSRPTSRRVADDRRPRRHLTSGPGKTTVLLP